MGPERGVGECPVLTTGASAQHHRSPNNCQTTPPIHSPCWTHARLTDTYGLKPNTSAPLELINRGYDKLIVAQIIGRTLKELNNKLHYEQMEESKRQQRRERINELRKRALSSTPDGPRKNYRTPARAVEYAPAIVFEERKARQAAEYRDLTSEFFGDPRPGYSQLDRRGRA